MNSNGGETMKTMTVRDKHVRLDQGKIERAMAILKAKTETATIEKALELVIEADILKEMRRKSMDRILARRKKLRPVKGDVTDWIREGRKERDRLYGG